MQLIQESGLLMVTHGWLIAHDERRTDQPIRPTHCYYARLDNLAAERIYDFSISVRSEIMLSEVNDAFCSPLLVGSMSRSHCNHISTCVQRHRDPRFSALDWIIETDALEYRAVRSIQRESGACSIGNPESISKKAHGRRRSILARPVTFPPDHSHVSPFGGIFPDGGHARIHDKNVPLVVHPNDGRSHQ